MSYPVMFRFQGSIGQLKPYHIIQMVKEGELVCRWSGLEWMQKWQNLLSQQNRAKRGKPLPGARAFEDGFPFD